MSTESQKLLGRGEGSSSAVEDTSVSHRRKGLLFKIGVPLVIVAVAVSLVVVLWLVPYLESLKQISNLQRAQKIQDENPMIDGHNDVPWQYRKTTNDSVEAINFAGTVEIWQTDIPRLQTGKVGAQFWSVYVPCDTQGKDAVRQTLEQIDVVHKMNLKYNTTFQLALSPNDIRENFKNKKISSLIGMEGAHQIDASMGTLRMMYRLGARYMTLAHSCNNEFADSTSNGCASAVDCRVGTCLSNNICSEPQTIGVTPIGESLILEMNRLGMLVDLSHVSAAAMERALSISQAPVIFSHSSAFGLCPHPRNVPDNVLLQLKENNGIVMVTFLSNYLTCTNNATLTDVVDHIDYIVKGVCPSWKSNCTNGTFPGIGVDFVGYGSDFDGATYFPAGLTDVSHFINLTEELLNRGYSEPDVIKIIGGNLLRVFDKVVAVSEELNAQFPNEEVIFPLRPCTPEGICRSNN